MNRQERRRQEKLARAGKRDSASAPAVAARIGGQAPFQVGGVKPAMPMAQPGSLSSTEVFRRAQGAFQAGRLREAWEICQRILQADPKHGEATALAGRLAWERGDYAQALPLLQEAMKLRPRDASAVSNYGAALQSLGKADQAIAIHRKAIRAEPAYVKGHANLGSALLQAGRHEEAAKSFRRALDLDKSFGEAQSGLGVSLQKMGDMEAAVAALRAAVELLPGQSSAHYNLAAALLTAGDAEGALAACDAGLSVAPGDTRSLAFKVGVQLALGARAEARALLGFETLVQAAPLEVPDGFDSLPAFNQALASHIQEHRSLQFEPPTKATRKGWQTGEILSRGNGVIGAFKARLEEAVTRYIEACPAASDHPFHQHRPDRWRLKGWAVVLESEGHQSGHIHPQAWLSAVYYVSVPAAVTEAADEHEGWIEFGRPGDDFPVTVEPELHLLQPDDGLLVLFPSYHYHRTLPFRSDQRRISFAFDVIPEA